MDDGRPGRSCPLGYRYAPETIADGTAFTAETLYVIGGLYGNGRALQTVLEMANGEPGGATLFFNGDFNWFNAKPDSFADINRQVLEHGALRGNVETELFATADIAGCGCAYPAYVPDAEVARSNAIMQRLRATASAYPALRARLGALPMHARAQIGPIRVGLVHGDADSLAGWGFSAPALEQPAAMQRCTDQFLRSGVDVFASSHTCLPLMRTLEAGGSPRIIVNNGAAGMPNFSSTQHGVITRISLRPAKRSLYGARIARVHVDAIAVHYDHDAWLGDFLDTWPAGSPARESYLARMCDGPSNHRTDAAPRRLKAPSLRLAGALYR